MVQPSDDSAARVPANNPARDPILPPIVPPLAAPSTGSRSATPAPHEGASEAKRIWDSTELFGNLKEILIRHGDDVYRLRCTRNQKLILQK